MKPSCLSAGAAILLLAAGPARAQEGQPSFDCAKASTAVETQICDSPDLAWYDRQMARTYALARDDADVAGAAVLKAIQTAFLKSRNACKGPAIYECVSAIYAARLDEIAGDAEIEGLTAGAYTSDAGLLALVTYPDGKAAISLSTIGGGDHTCTFETDTAKATAGGGAFFNQKPDPSYEQACKLTVTPGGTTMSVATEGDGCTYYCGMRATLDGNFTRKKN